MKNNQHRTPKFWNVCADQGSGKAVITLEGEICTTPPTDLCGNVAKGYYSNEEFRKDIAKCENMSEVIVNINSIGGDLYQGIAIHNALKGLQGKVTTVIQGIAASAASIIFCAGTERLVYPGSAMMAHGVMSFIDFYGFVNEHDVSGLQAQLKNLKKSIGVMNRCVADIYASATGKSQEECLTMISDNTETYMSGADAIAEGFATGYACDGYQPKLRMVACAGKRSLISNNVLLSDDFHAPANAVALGIVETEEPPTQSIMENTETETVEVTTTIEPTATTASQMVDVQAAIAADRKRIAEIDTIAKKFGNQIPAALVARAKYGADGKDPMSREQFAIEVLNVIEVPQMQQNARAEELAAANSVSATPGAIANAIGSDGVLRDSKGVRADIAALIDKSTK